MAVTLISAGSTSNSGASQTSASLVFDATGCDFLVAWLLARVSSGNAGMTNLAATYSGVSMTLVPGSPFESGNLRLGTVGFYLPSPATGSNTISISWTQPQQGTVVGAQGFSGAAGSIGTPGSFSGTSESTASVTITSNTGDMVVSGIGTVSNAPTSGNTQDFNLNIAGVMSGAGSHSAGSSSVVMSWTQSGTVDIALAAFNILSAGNFSTIRWGETWSEPVKYRNMPMIGY